MTLYFLFQLDISSKNTPVDLESAETNIDVLLSTINDALYDGLMLSKCRACYYFSCVFSKNVNTRDMSISSSTSHSTASDTGTNRTTATPLKRGMKIRQGVLFWTLITTSTECHFDFIVDNALRILDVELSAAVNYHQNVSFSVSLRDVNKVLASRDANSECLKGQEIVGKSHILQCNVPPFFFKKKPCPEFHLEYSEFASLPHGTRKTMLSHFFDTQQTLDENTTVNVCVDEYNEIMSKLNESTTSHTQTLELFLIILTLFM